MPLEQWERVIEAASRVQRILPEAILVGGSASALHCKHRFSNDDDHVIADLKERFDEVLTTLQSYAGWETARTKPPVLILGNFEGVETGIRNLIRSAPLETEVYDSPYGPVVLPTLAEMARIKAWLIVSRNATRDYIDFAALSQRIHDLDGDNALLRALSPMDRLYPQPHGESTLRQLAKQLADPLPYDLGDADLSQYRILDERWHSWDTIRETTLWIGSKLEVRELEGLSIVEEERNSSGSV